MPRADLTLEIGDGTRLVDPSATQIRQALMSLHGARDPFALMERPDGRLVQVHGSHVDGFILEYRPASGALMRRAEDPAVPLDVALRVFEAVRTGEPRPLGSLTWKFETVAQTPDLYANGQRRWAPLWVAFAGLALLAAGILTRQPVWNMAGLSVLGLFCLVSVADGFRTGIIEGRGGRVSRSLNPIQFWFNVGLQMILGLVLLLAAATALTGDR